MKMLPAIHTLTVSPEELTSERTREMLSLLVQNFHGVTQSQFEQDLEEKNRIILLLRNERLVGFSTLLACTTFFEGRSINVIYSGDTIIAPEAWGTTALPRAWIFAVNCCREELPEGRCYWLLLTSGFRTYRFLTVFWREFFPCFERVTPPEQQRLLDQLALERYGSHYDARRGIVRFQNPQRLRTGLNQIAQGRVLDPHVAFFALRNPGHTNGDELVCLTELCPENLTAAGRRMTLPKTRAHHCNHR